MPHTVSGKLKFPGLSGRCPGAVNVNIGPVVVKRRTALIQVLQSNSSDLLPYLYKFLMDINFVVFMDNVWSTKIKSLKIYIL